MNQKWEAWPTEGQARHSRARGAWLGWGDSNY